MIHKTQNINNYLNAIHNNVISDNDIIYIKDVDNNIEKIVLGKNSLSFNTVPEFSPSLKGRLLTISEDGKLVWGDTSIIEGRIDSLEAEHTTMNSSITSINNNLTTLTNKLGIANGIATLDSQGLVPSTQLPSYVDDVLMYDSLSVFPVIGEAGKIYVDTSTNKQYRWPTGNEIIATYVEISSSLALGENANTAFAGNKGKVAYDHALAKGVALTSGLYNIITNSEGHIISATPVSKSDITKLGIPAQDTTYSNASSSNAGLMSANDYTKLQGIATGAQVNTVIGVKGNAESSYRTGNINITPANIGAATSNHTHSYLPLSGGTMTGNINMGGKAITNFPYVAGNSSYGISAGLRGLKLLTYWDGYTANGIGSNLLGSSGNHMDFLVSYDKNDSNNSKSLSSFRFMNRHHSSYSSVSDINTLAEIDGNGNLNTTGQIKENGTRVYSPNNKPSASDINAAAYNHTHTPSSIGAASSSHTHSIASASASGFLSTTLYSLLKRVLTIGYCSGSTSTLIYGSSTYKPTYNSSTSNYIISSNDNIMTLVMPLLGQNSYARVSAKGLNNIPRYTYIDIYNSSDTHVTGSFYYIVIDMS